MTCREFWNSMPDLEPEGRQFEHARECPSCAALLERQRALAAGLRRVARERRSLEAPARVETRLMSAFREAAGLPMERPAGLWWTRPLTWAPVAAAVVALAVLLVWNAGVRPVGAPASIAQVAGFETGDAGEPDSDFIQLTGATETGAVEDGDVLQVEAPRSVLVALGAPLEDGDAGENMRVELLLGAGGIPQAVRLLQ